jgi:hypothetical protein
MTIRKEEKKKEVMKLVISHKFVLTAGSPPVPNLPFLLLIFLVRSSVVRVKLTPQISTDRLPNFIKG